MKYNASNPPEGEWNWQVFRYWIMEEILHIERTFLGVENIQLPEMHRPPAKVRTGMIVLADGTDWDPGAGAGFYGYRAGGWVKLG